MTCSLVLHKAEQLYIKAKAKALSSRLNISFAR